MAMTEFDPQDLTRKNLRTGLIVLGVVALMTGLSFASVPLYSLFCRVTGFGGTPLAGGTLPEKILDRSIRVQFNADTGLNMPWSFRPEKRAVDLRLGERGLMAFEAQNRAAEPVAGTAVYNVTPPKAGKYFHKIQCFCFDEQVLKPGEKVLMPVVFYIDPALDSDPNLGDVETITLSYTFFRADSKELEGALDAFYNGAGPR